MSQERHFTTRRSFVAGMGFGGLGLYATWAAYGASPLPFSSMSSGGDIAAHGGHATAAADTDPAIAMHEGGQISPAEFTRRHAEFLARFKEADGSIRPAAVSAESGHQSHGAMTGHAGAPASMDMSDPAAHAAHAAHGATSVSPAAPPVGGHDGATAAGPIEVYFLAGRFSFEPERLRLQVGQPYRFHMMASDVAHGASIAFGRASRIVRLRPDTVTALDLIFRGAGAYLVYCTVYCGPGHDGMRGLITVA
jgi:cytochrome c oxidase subunit II